MDSFDMFKNPLYGVKIMYLLVMGICMKDWVIGLDEKHIQQQNDQSQMIHKNSFTFSFLQTHSFTLHSSALRNHNITSILLTEPLSKTGKE